MALVSADVYRPAAIEQLETLAGDVGARFIPSAPDEAPVAIAARAAQEAERQLDDVLIVDTAGRLGVDADMMGEISALQETLQPVETLFVVDAMTGQDAAVTAKAFDEALTLTGVILAKADGDARGGAALSVRFITGKPIKFIGTGERPDALEPFSSRPARIPHSGHGRPAQPDRGKPNARVEQAQGRPAGAQDHPGKAVRPRGLPRSVAADGQPWAASAICWKSCPAPSICRRRRSPGSMTGCSGVSG